MLGIGRDDPSTEMPDFDRDTLGLATPRTAASVGLNHLLTLQGGSQEALQPAS